MLKSVSSVTNAIGALNYKGTWNASTNTPTLASGVGFKGDYFVVSVAGSTNLDGISNWGVGDWAAYNGTVWQRVEGGADLNGVNLSVSGNSDMGNIRIASNTISSQNTDGNIALAPNGTGQVIVNAGAVGTPTIAPTGDTNTGIFFPAADTIAFAEGGAEIVRFDNAGNLLVGTTSANGPGGASIVGRLFKTVAGTGTVNNASSNTLFAIGTVNAYLVTVQTGNVSGLSTTALVHYAPGGNPPVRTNLVQDNVNFAITLSGNNVRITNNLGGAVGYDFSAIRIY